MEWACLVCYNTVMDDIFVCSAYRDLEENLVLARRYCRYVMDQDEDANPFAPHVFYTQFLDNKNKVEWTKGFELGVARLLKSKGMYVFVRNGVLTDGMVYEINQAMNAGPPRTYFDATDIDNIVELRHLDGFLGIPTSAQLMAPKPFASAASSGLESIAEQLLKGVRYEDLQDSLETFLGPLDATEPDPEADLQWEENYRSGRG